MMPRRLALVVLAVLMLGACMARRAPVEDAVQPLPAGITPLTVEQDHQIGG